MSAMSLNPFARYCHLESQVACLHAYMHERLYGELSMGNAVCKQFHVCTSAGQKNPSAMHRIVFMASNDFAEPVMAGCMQCAFDFAYVLLTVNCVHQVCLQREFCTAAMHQLATSNPAECLEQALQKPCCH